MIARRIGTAAPAPRSTLDAAISEAAERARVEVLLRGDHSALVRLSPLWPRHWLHAGATVVTRGWWAPVWVGLALAHRPQRWRVTVDDRGRVQAQRLRGWGWR
ncbi:hypothetical protein [Nocardia terpenica]|uniref:Uncharacterized protein n=1 Tax=Nocardia terpenica TaxID=455432 RepID=A0A6G9ZFD5_9NOCA|nr:hypothetical protein [Nocardia terpenica]QIS23703.1 hypothetical protein F6W96_40925 [Nocardia terpenica]